MGKTLLLITESFPLGGLTEEAFVRPELEALSAAAERVIVAPLMDRGPEAGDLPLNVVVARDIVDTLSWRHKWLRPVLHPAAIFRCRDIRYALAAAAVERGLRRIIRRYGLSAATTAAEAFWFDVQAVALSRLDIPYVVRAHGYDIRMTRARSLRARAIGRSRGVYAVSEDGAAALREQFPAEAANIATAFLGVDIPATTTAHTPAGVRELRVLSVARVIPLKRVDMGLTMLNALATARPDLKIFWTHIGDGPGLDTLREACTKARANLTITLPGALPHSRLMELYAEATVDWMMHWSSAEGLPIALLEGMARGIPVVATAVGGTAEAVDDDSGILMAPDPEPEEFVRGIIPYLDSRARYDRVAEGARRRVSETFNAAELRRAFAHNLISLTDRP